MIEEEIYNDWVPLNKRQKLSLVRILAIASGNLVPGLLWNIVFALFEPFIKLLGISSTTKTILLLYGSLIGFILGPAVGVFSDGLMLKFGRRRIFIIIGSIIIIISLLLMMFSVDIGNSISPSNPQPYRKGTFIISIILAFTAGNIVQSPARMICSDLAPVSQQSLMSNICQVYIGVSSIFSNLLGGLGTYRLTSLEQEQFLLVISLSFAFIAMTISVIAAQEEPLHVKPPGLNPFKQIWESFKKIPKSFVRVVPSFFLSNVATYQYQVCFSDFMGCEVMRGDNRGPSGSKLRALYQTGVSWSMMCNCVNNCVQLFYGFVNSNICEALGMKTVLVVGNGLMAVSLLLFLFVSNCFAFLAFSALIGLGNVVYMAIPYAIVSIVIPNDELGSNLGILNCFCVLGQQVSNFVIGRGFANLYNNSPRKNIGYSSVFGFLAMIASFWVVQPTLADAGKYDLISDTSGIEVCENFCH